MAFNKIPHLLILILIGSCCSCTCYKKWEDATVTYKNGFEISGKICSKEKSFFSHVKFSSQEGKNKEILFPDKIKYISSETNKLVSLHFDENTYGVDSYSFGKILAADQNNQINIIDTRYIVNDCNCAGRNKYLNDFFIVYYDKILKIETNRTGKILNINNIYGFINNNMSIKLTSDVDNIDTLSDFINNINN